jgi:hypothetical protein
MRCLVGVLFTVLLFLSGCATAATGPRLSQTEVRQIADGKVRRTMTINLRQYRISELQYIPREGSWSVTYQLKANKRVAFTVRVFDEIQKASSNESDSGVFEGGLTEKNDFH